MQRSNALILLDFIRLYNLIIIRETHLVLTHKIVTNGHHPQSIVQLTVKTIVDRSVKVTSLIILFSIVICSCTLLRRRRRRRREERLYFLEMRDGHSLKVQLINMIDL